MKTKMIFEVEEEQKQKIREASQILGIGISTFCRMVLLQNASQIIKQKREDSE